LQLDINCSIIKLEKIRFGRVLECRTEEGLALYLGTVFLLNMTQ